jgi:hypothetical protein
MKAQLKMLQRYFLSYIFMFYKQFYFVIFGLEIIGHGTP